MFSLRLLRNSCQLATAALASSDSGTAGFTGTMYSQKASPRHTWVPELNLFLPYKPKTSALVVSVNYFTSKPGTKGQVFTPVGSSTTWKYLVFASLVGLGLGDGLGDGLGVGIGDEVGVGDVVGVVDGVGVGDGVGAFTFLHASICLFCKAVNFLADEIFLVAPAPIFLVRQSLTDSLRVTAPELERFIVKRDSTNEAATSLGALDMSRRLR